MRAERWGVIVESRDKGLCCLAEFGTRIEAIAALALIRLPTAFVLSRAEQEQELL